MAREISDYQRYSKYRNKRILAIITLYLRCFPSSSPPTSFFSVFLFYILRLLRRIPRVKKFLNVYSCCYIVSRVFITRVILYLSLRSDLSSLFSPIAYLHFPLSYLLLYISLMRSFAESLASPFLFLHFPVFLATRSAALVSISTISFLLYLPFFLSPDPLAQAAFLPLFILSAIYLPLLSSLPFTRSPIRFIFRSRCFSRHSESVCIAVYVKVIFLISSFRENVDFRNIFPSIENSR